MRLLILRHGESRSNADPHAVALPEKEGDQLTERGREQAAEAARWLGGRDFDALISSPMRRARQTAEAVAAATGADIAIDEGIHELRESGGYLELPPEEQKLKRWSVWMAEHGDDPDWAPEGGESFNAVLGRVTAFKARLEQRRPDETVLAVSHGIFTRFFLFHSLLEERFRATDVHRLWHLRTANCGLSAFDHGERRHPADPEVRGWSCASWMACPWAEGGGVFPTPRP
jgi:broad specificity phosphatase PhoE